MLAPAYEKLHDRYGDDVMVVAYMNTSGRVKALAGRSGGSVCTSSNAGMIMRWAVEQGRKIFFVPDQHLGRNVAAQVGMDPGRVHLLSAGHEGGEIEATEWQQIDRSDLILWGSFCGVHTIFKPRHVEYWKERGYQVVVHPESPREVVAVADGSGSTSFLWNHVIDAAAGSRFAVGTEGHFVRNLREQAAARNIEVVHLAETMR
jgi:quinolinate synthase